LSRLACATPKWCDRVDHEIDHQAERIRGHVPLLGSTTTTAPMRGRGRNSIRALTFRGQVANQAQEHEKR